ncbi:MAG TPA: UvrD-helicase domain-containing protein, partial [Candidatus Binataceae bacterium]|nr:UvrD-helicase domain-containing protein [Candidatus Binataceae bacterium]
VALIAGDLGDGAPLDPAQIAAITFTEKAALDMRGRIAAVLAERLERETDAARRTHLMRAERTIGLARISTIHAFCARILRENPIAAGLDPDFEVLDEYESAIFAERVCRDELVKAVAAKNTAALQLVRARRMDDDTPRETALEIIQRMLVEARRRGYPPEWIVKLTERRQEALDEEEDRVAASAQALVDLIDKLLRVKVTGKAAEARDELGRAWAEGRARVLALDRSAEPRAVEVLRALREKLPDARSPLIKDQVTAIRAIVNSAGTKYGLSGELISAWGEYRAAAPAVEFARLVAAVGAAIAKAQASDRVVTFDDLLIATRDLLGENREIAHRYRRELRAILVDEYQDTNAPQDEIVALLTDPLRDEASDPPLFGRPSPNGDSGRDSQTRSLTPLRSDSAPPGLFIVGDEKQSIYRFRGADVRVFNRPRASAPVELPLAENRRSTPNILNFVNGVAAIAMKAEAGDAAAADYRITWRPEYRLRPTRAVTSDYAVEYIVAIPSRSAAGAAAPKLEVVERRELEAQALADLIQRIVAAREPLIDRATGAARPAEYRDFAILLRAFPDIAIYENALAAAGIPAYTVKGRGFYARREVIDLANLLAAIDDPHDSLALAITLRSPCFGLSDDCLLALGLRLHEGGSGDGRGSLAELFDRGDFAWLEIERSEAEAAAQTLRKLRSLRDRESLQVVVERALELTDYESVMAGLPQSDQRIANLRKLMELARGFDTHRFFTFHDFVAYLRRLIEEEPFEPQAQIPGETDNVVRLMTVHQAKGLEFAIVIIADAGRRPPQENRSPQLDPVNGLLLAATDGSGYDELPHTGLERYKKRLK